MSLHSQLLRNLYKVRSGLVLGMILFIALVAFETFNYSTTQYALSDLLGNLHFRQHSLGNDSLDCFLSGLILPGLPACLPRTRPRRNARSLVSVWRLAAGGNDERHPHLVGRFDGNYEPYRAQHRIRQSLHDYPGGACISLQSWFG